MELEYPGGGTLAFAMMANGNAKFVEIDAAGGHGTVGSGAMEKVDTTSYSTAKIVGDYAFGVAGLDGSNNRTAIAGRFTANGAGTFPQRSRRRQSVRYVFDVKRFLGKLHGNRRSDRTRHHEYASCGRRYANEPEFCLLPGQMPGRLFAIGNGRGHPADAIAQWRGATAANSHS